MSWHLELLYHTFRGKSYETASRDRIIRTLSPGANALLDLPSLSVRLVPLG
jgi:hypothetical protein